MKKYLLELGMLLFCLVIFTLMFSSCTTSTEHRRKLLPEYYPDCEVLDDGTLKCPDIEAN